MLTLAEAKEWLKIDGDAEDNLLSSLIVVAEKVVKNSSKTDIDPTSELAKQAAKIYIQYLHEGGEDEGLLKAFDALLLHLKYDGDAV